jgi:RimJ/RimL family protein N-acetyltransferase
MPTLESERLSLRPFRPGDASAVQAQCGNWNVARMLARVPHPYTRDLAERWIASLGADREHDDEYTFCIELAGETIGSIGLRRTADRTYEMGYWLGEAWWGEGIATEAAREVVHFAFGRLGAEKLCAGHFHDNPASGRVLEKCGFRYIGESMMPCEARGEAVAHKNFECSRDEMEGRSEKS